MLYYMISLSDKAYVQSAINADRSGGQDIFVLSDLHIGNGSSKDNLLRSDRRILLYRLLDKIDREEGRLVILGDLFELLRYDPEAVFEQWSALLDHLSGLDVIYVPGNHDGVLWEHRDYWCSQHSFFHSLQKPFAMMIGGKRFFFMHGHEVDPMISEQMAKWRTALSALVCSLELGTNHCLITSDIFTDALLEAGEQCLHWWGRLTRRWNRAVHEHLAPCQDGWRRLICPIRTRNMMARFFEQHQQGVYDVTVTGHTHRAGQFGSWYYNCGSWTQPVVNYVRIRPDGEVAVTNYSACGEQVNQTAVL